MAAYSLSHPTQGGCEKHREIKPGWIRCEMQQLGDVDFDFQVPRRTRIWGTVNSPRLDADQDALLPGTVFGFIDLSEPQGLRPTRPAAQSSAVQTLHANAKCRLSKVKAAALGKGRRLTFGGQRRWSPHSTICLAAKKARLAAGFKMARWWRRGWGWGRDWDPSHRAGDQRHSQCRKPPLGILQLKTKEGQRQGVKK